MEGAGASLAIAVQETGKELARGNFSRVVEVLFCGLRCKAKRYDPAVCTNSTKMARACVQLARLRHPHVVQFLGSHDGGLVIVCEYLPYSLFWALERYGCLPEPLTHSILRDVAMALSYLHGLSPAVTHGYLHPNNVLLTADFTAKLSDVGVARTVELLGRLPKESQVYVAPDGDGMKGDIYSFGVVMVHAVGGTHPASIAGAQSQGGPLSGQLGVAERHPLSGLMKDCLNSDPRQRPVATQVLSMVSLEMTKFPPITIETRLEGVNQLRVGPQAHPLTLARKASVSPQRNGRGGSEADRNMALSIKNESLKLQVEELLVANRGLKGSLDRQVKLVSARDHEMAAKLMAKDQEILARQQEVAAKEALQVAAENNLTAKEATLQGVSRQLIELKEYLDTRAEPHLFNPKAQLQWRRCADLPNGMVFGQAVTVGESVYFGSGTSTLGEAGNDCPHKIFKYSSMFDCWQPLTDCPVVAFGMGCYLGQLALVGGAYESDNTTANSSFSTTGDVHLLDEAKQEWKKPLPAMMQPRLLPTIAAHRRGLLALGGIVLNSTHDYCLSSVEAYDEESGQWYRAEPLPLACIGMTSALVGDAFYLMGGYTDTEFDHPTVQVFSASLPDLVQDAIDRHGLLNGTMDEHTAHIWRSCLDAPRYAATAANLGNSLLALGGSDERLVHKSGALHIFSPLTNAWIRIEDIPVNCFACAAAKLPGGEILIIGGMGEDEEDALKTVYRTQIKLI